MAISMRSFIARTYKASFVFAFIWQGGTHKFSVESVHDRVTTRPDQQPGE